MQWSLPQSILYISRIEKGGFTGGMEGSLHGSKAPTKKVEKEGKKVLTNGGGGGILIKLSGADGREPRAAAKSEKKYLTNRTRCGKI